MNINKLRPFFYIVCLSCIIIVIFESYIGIHNNNKILAVGNVLNIEDVGKSIKLKRNNKNNYEIINYEIEDDNIINIDENDILLSINEGTTKVTVTNHDKSKIQTFVVNVSKKTLNDKEDKDTTNSSTPNNSSGNTSSNSSNSNNGTPNNSSGSTSSNNDKIINVTGISLNKTNTEIYLNSSIKTISLTANVAPENATNKKVSWHSSNTSVATVTNGIVTAIKPGIATISAKTEDGNKVASITITVKKKVIIVIGASQVTRMAKYKNSYSTKNFNYNTNNGTLIYIEKSGSGINYQTNEGLKKAKEIINQYNNEQKQIDFYIYFPLSGNTIKTFTCDQISTSNNSIIQYVKNYNNSILQIKNAGYNVKGYVISMHPVKVSQTKSSNVVTNEDVNACTANYRSNWKYYQFNKVIKYIIQSNYNTTLKYESLFIKIMNVNENKKNFSYKIAYNTTDGVHWDSATTNTYVNMMFENNPDL